MKYIKTILLLSIVLIALSGCAATKGKTSEMPGKDAAGKTVQDSVLIKPSASYEECIELYPGMVLDYEFNASDFIDFNIHHHANDAVHYPVLNKGVVMGRGMLDPRTHPYYTGEQEYYCVMWDNVTDGPVKVSYKCVVTKK